MVLKNLLKVLELDPELNQSEHVSGEDIYEFVIQNCGNGQVAYTLEFYFIELAANAISEQLFRQDDYGDPSFNEDDIVQLLQDRDEKEYHFLFEHYFKKQEFLEYHNINGETYFFGKDLKIKYDVLLKMFAVAITSDLNRVLEKLKRHLSENVDLVSWLNLMTGGIEDNYIQSEKDRMSGIINGVLA